MGHNNLNPPWLRRPPTLYPVPFRPSSRSRSTLSSCGSRPSPHGAPKPKPSREPEPRPARPHLLLVGFTPPPPPWGRRRPTRTSSSRASSRRSARPSGTTKCSGLLPLPPFHIFSTVVPFRCAYCSFRSHPFRIFHLYYVA